MRLFKFCGESGVNILGCLQLRLTPPNEFNDPFEFSVVYDPSMVTKADVLSEMDAPYIFDHWHKTTRPNDSLEEARQHYEAHRQEIADEFLQNITTRNAAMLESDNCRIASPWWLVSCFSRSRDSIAMWSHYANQHKGIVIEFETDGFPAKVLEEAFALDVKYDNTKPVYKYRVGMEGFDKDVIAMSSVKGLEWQYENESRFVVPSTLLKGQRFMPFEAPAIRSVTLGVRCSQQLSIHVHSLLRQPEFRHIVLYGSKMNRSEYKLEFFQIPNP